MIKLISILNRRINSTIIGYNICHDIKFKQSQWNPKNKDIPVKHYIALYIRDSIASCRTEFLNNGSTFKFTHILFPKSINKQYNTQK